MSKIVSVRNFLIYLPYFYWLSVPLAWTAYLRYLNTLDLGDGPQPFALFPIFLYCAFVVLASLVHSLVNFIILMNNPAELQQTKARLYSIVAGTVPVLIVVSLYIIAKLF